MNQKYKIASGFSSCSSEVWAATTEGMTGPPPQASVVLLGGIDVALSPNCHAIGVNTAPDIAKLQGRLDGAAGDGQRRGETGGMPFPPVTLTRTLRTSHGQEQSPGDQFAAHGLSG